MLPLRRVAAWLVLLSLIVTQSVGLVESRRHAALGDDSACLGPSVNIAGTHHADGAQFESPLPSPPLEHCAFCHLQRAFSNARPTNSSSMFLPPLSAAVAPDTAVRLTAGVRVAFSPRGPPASL